jgi:hypothetical protein
LPDSEAITNRVESHAKEVSVRYRFWLFLLLLMGAGLLLARNVTPQKASHPPAASHELKLWNTVPAPGGAGLKAKAAPVIKVAPGNKNEATKYYEAIRPNLMGFPKPTLAESSIDDMLAYYGFPALPPAKLESLAPAMIMDFEQLRKAISTPEFEAAYKDHPLQAGEILVTRFFAPKIINVNDPWVNDAPVGGYGWRKVLRFRARAGSLANKAKLDAFYLLFNFTSGAATAFPEGIHAAQIQSMLVPAYPSTGTHRDAYFLVYDKLDSPTPGKVGYFLTASFDLSSVVKPVPEDRYYVPRACGQCHGTETDDQKGAKVNYLDTDHWIDRTDKDNDFPKIPAANVLVDGAPSYVTYRQLNGEIEKQNDAVIKQSGGAQFALLAVQKWLEIHKEGTPSADQHVPPLLRGFGTNPWKDGATPDTELLPLLNQYCFRCHSSVRYHVFDRAAVLSKKSSILARVKSGNMPQDRNILDKPVKDKIVKLMEQLNNP